MTCNAEIEGLADNFLALEITWWEKGNGVMLEAGICACRCRNIDAMVSVVPRIHSGENG